MSPATRWKLVPVALLLPMVAFAAWRLQLALADPHFAVEEDYYDRAASWDEARAKRQRSALLGWKVRWDAAGGALRLTVEDARGAPVTGLSGTVEAFHNAHPADRRRAAVQPVAGATGVYRAALEPGRAGWWQWRLRLERDEDLYLEERRTRVARPEEPAAGDAGEAGR